MHPYLEIANSQTWCTNICTIQLLRNRMSSISSNLYEKNRPIKFHVSQCWIILKKNLESFSYFETFWCFVKFSFYHKWNDMRLLFGIYDDAYGYPVNDCSSKELYWNRCKSNKPPEINKKCATSSPAHPFAIPGSEARKCTENES